jgi:hypothetical protein
MTRTVGVLDALVARVLDTYPYRFTRPVTAGELALAYRIRADAVVDEGWAPAEAFPAGLEHDEFDEHAVHVLGWYEDDPVSTGRIVLPPGELPTELACGLQVEPRGRVVDVGRMAVVRSHRTLQHAAFLALLCRLYLEMRTRGFDIACGMMSRRVRRLVTLLGLDLEQLGDERPYWGEQRAPVRFVLTANVAPVQRRWT